MTHSQLSADGQEGAQEKPLHVRVAEALGWIAWAETRGEYTLAVALKPGAKEPWKNSRPEYQQPERYKRITCVEAQKLGFFGEGFPRYDTDWSATGPLIEKYRIDLYYGHDEDEPAWTACLAVPGAIQAFADTPLRAVCRFILALKEAGKL